MMNAPTRSLFFATLLVLLSTQAEEQKCGRPGNEAFVQCSVQEI